MKFLIDNQLPAALARFIQTEFKVQATHVIDVGLRDASDAEIWNYVSESDSILISKDEDFANMVLLVPTAKLIWVRFGNCRKEFLLKLFQHMWSRILDRLDGGDRLIRDPVMESLKLSDRLDYCSEIGVGAGIGDGRRKAIAGSEHVFQQSLDLLRGRGIAIEVELLLDVQNTKNLCD